MIGIRRPRPVLDAMIRKRAAGMFANGLLAEVEGLRGRGYGPELGPMTGHGYREAFEVLAGELTTERAIEVTALHTRQYAKRQMTWFSRDPRIAWLEPGKGSARELAPDAVERLRPLLSAG
jgi:tRNA dimethylallyltransferase